MQLPKPCPLPSPESTHSFWHSQPALRRHRTTPHLPEHIPFAIIGSGITGASAAHYLAQRLAQSSHSATTTTTTTATSPLILMLEAREACWGATGRNGGHLQPLLRTIGGSNDTSAGSRRRQATAAAHRFAFEQRNCAAVAALAQAHDIACELPRGTGRRGVAVRAFWDRDVWEVERAAWERVVEVAPWVGRVVREATPEDLRAAQVGSGVVGAFVTSGTASLWPYKFVVGILERLIESGQLNLQTWTPVTQLVETENGKWMLETSRGSVVADKVLLATNAYTSHLLPTWSDLITPTRESMTALIPPECQGKRLPVTYGFTGQEHDSDYLIQRPSYPDGKLGELMLGGGAFKERVPGRGEADDNVLDETVVDYLSGLLFERLDLRENHENITDKETDNDKDSVKAKEKLKVRAAWTGIWGLSIDRIPWVGPVPDHKGVFLSGAYSGHGMSNSTLCAKAAIEMLTADDSEKAGQKLTESGELPEEFLITKDRITRARNGKGKIDFWL